MIRFLKRACFGKQKKFMKTFLFLFVDNWLEKLPLSIGGLAFFLLLTRKNISNGIIYSLLGILILQFVLYALARRNSYIYMFETVADSVKGFQLDLGNKLRKLPMGMFYKKSSAEMLKVIVDDHKTVNNTWLNVIFLSCSIIVNLIVLIILIPILNIPMALVTFLVIPLSIPFVGISLKGYQKKARKMKQIQVESSENLMDYVKGITVLKLFNMGSREYSRLDESLREHRDACIDIEKSIFPITTFANSIINIGIGIVALAGIYFMKHGQLTPLIYLIFLFVVNQIYSPIMTFYLYLSEMINFKYAVDRIYDFHDIKEVEEGKIESVGENKEIEYEDVDFSYHVKPILHQVSAMVEQNTLNAIVGPSGCGKTTMLKLLLRYFEPDQGMIKLGKNNIKDYTTETLLSQYAMVFQDVFLFNQTIEYNIQIGNINATKEQIVEAAKLSNCHEFIMEQPQGYETIAGVKGAKLSAGQRQRISIARAFLKDAPIILMDEPTSSLDIENEVMIKEALNRLVKKKTVILISHRLAFIQNVDRIFIMDQGKIIDYGSHDEVLSVNKLYQKLWADEHEIVSWML